MNIKYKNWIDKWLLTSDPLGRCQYVTSEMQKAFPELIRVRGHYFDVMWGERQHWWLETTEGEIVDPTASQFPTKGNGYYEKWDESQEEPCGKCMNCGDLCYMSKGFGMHACSENCCKELEFYYG
jgi:hypothetical protein